MASERAEGGPAKGLRVVDLGTPARLIRAGRLGLDLAASFVLAPLGLFALFIGLFGVVILGTRLAAALLGAAGALGAAQVLAGMAGDGPLGPMLAAAAALPLVVAALGGVTAAARAPRAWALLALLPAAGFMMLLGAVGPPLPDRTTWTLSVLLSALTWGLGGALSLAALLLLAGIRARRRTPEGKAVQAWPVFSIPIFAARFGLGRSGFWARSLRAVAKLVLGVVGLAALFVGAIFLSGLAAYWALRLLGLPAGGFEQLFFVMDILAWAAVCALSAASARRSPSTRLVDVPVAALAAFAALELSFRCADGVLGARGLGGPGGFSSPVAQEELEALNAIPMVWLFRGLVSRVVLRAWDELRQAAARTARELSDRRPEPPILFLRSFMDDEQTVPSSDAPLAHAFGSASPAVRLEELVADLMFARGPLVALANPMVKSLPPGAARDVAADENWKEKVGAYLEKSRLIVCFLGKTRSFLWEIDKIIAQSKLDSTLVVLPPSYPGDRQLVTYSPRLAALMGLRDEADERERLAGARVLAFDAGSGSFLAVRSERADSFAYREAILLGASTLLRNRRGKG